MIYLEEFVQSFTKNQKLLAIAHTIRARVLHVRMDAFAKGLELTLNLLGTVPSGTALADLENGLRSELSLTHIRLFLSGFPKDEKTPAAMIHQILPWIISAVKRENPLFGALVSSARFEVAQNVLTGHLYHCLDGDLENEFVMRIDAFMHRYLEVQCPFVWEYNSEESSVSPAALAKEQAESLRREAHEALIQSAQCRSSGEESPHSVNPLAKSRFGSGGGIGGQSAQHKPKPAAGKSVLSGKAPQNGRPAADYSDIGMPEPPPVNQDSWEYKAKEAAKENKTVFTRTPKANGILWGKGNPTLPVIKIQEMNANTGIVQFDGNVEIDTFNLTKAGNKVRVNFYVTDGTGCISCVYFMQPSDADSFEERFKKGGYARFQANVYYDDKYSRDLQASVDGVMEKDAPGKRQDLADVKRVELHCHSKMSEKDAVNRCAPYFSGSRQNGPPRLCTNGSRCSAGFS